MKENRALEKVLDFGRKIIPKKIFLYFQPAYHFLLAVCGALIYGFPGRKIKVIGVTGTKGKSTTAEMVNAILEASGKKTALASTVRYKIGNHEWKNLFKMTLRGRFFTQSFLNKAVKDGCDFAILELSSEGVKQYRHKFLFLDALIFTNLHPEHIESHGSYEKYVNAKVEIAKELQNSSKNTVIIANTDSKEAEKFLSLNVPNKIPYSLSNAISVKSDVNGSTFQIEKVVIHSKLAGVFNVSNMIGAIKCAEFFGSTLEEAKIGLEKLEKVRGRMEKVNVGQEFEVVVDYAHTKESLEAIYGAYKGCKKVCVLGNTGGGRDKWKRKVMAEVADNECDYVILTNEDPYDEDPMSIISDMKAGVTKKPLEVILDRREAIGFALSKAKEINSMNSSGKKTAVLITGKGSDPYIMGPNGSKVEWDDAKVAKEELHKIMDQEF